MSTTPSPQISPSLLAADLSRLGEEVRALEAAGADRLHFDVMDGHFVPNLTFGPDVLKALRPHTSLPVDVHLMVSDPDFLLERFAEAGAHSLTIHEEITADVPSLLKKIKTLGLKTGLALNPETSPACLLPLLDLLDLILVMTVHPGRGGQPFIPGQEKKILSLKKIIAEKNIKIQVDGGISRENVGLLASNGADVLVAGTAVLKAPCYRQAIDELRFFACGEQERSGVWK